MTPRELQARTRLWILVLAVALVLSGLLLMVRAARGQSLTGFNSSPAKCDPGHWLRDIESGEVDTYTVTWTGRTLSAAEVLSVSIVKVAQADASPGDMIVAGPSVSGSTMTFRVNPDQGCGAAGCRVGNHYVWTFRVTDGSNTPTEQICQRVVATP